MNILIIIIAAIIIVSIIIYIIQGLMGDVPEEDQVDWASIEPQGKFSSHQRFMKKLAIEFVRLIT